MKYGAIKDFCRKNGINLKLNWALNYNCVRYHDSRETVKHFMYKAAIVFELLRRRQTVFTEFEFVYGKRTSFNSKRMMFPVADIFWLDEKLVVELESHPREAVTRLKHEQFKDFNCFVFDISRYSVEEILKKIGVIQPDGGFPKFALQIGDQ